MKILIKDDNNNTIVDNTDDTCKACIRDCQKPNCKVLCPISNTEERRMGKVNHKDKVLFLCSSRNMTKTSKLFDEKMAMLIYSIPSIINVQNIAMHNERQKYELIVHNLKTLNAQSIQTQYRFISQQLLSDNYENIYECILDEVQHNPKEAARTILQLAKNNAHMKTEFTTHEKLSMETPILSFQEHDIRSVILNVYHSFEIDFRDNNSRFRISDNGAKVRIDYDTTRVALYHMFSNAIKYMQNGTPLQVNIETDNENTVVKFNMRSLFINKDEIDKIFEDGYSGINTRNQNKNGKGLGMGLIKKALTLNNAYLDILRGTNIIKYKKENYSDNVFKIVFKS